MPEISFKDMWFHDVPKLIAKTDAAYAQLVAIGKPDKAAVTKKKIYENRGWLPAKSYIEKNFDAVIQRLGVFYLPKMQFPGPAFVFPLRDLDGVSRQAQVRPFEDSWLWMPDHKYRLLGTAVPTHGPRWYGNDDQTLLTVIRKRTVVLVEGCFDVLACKLLVPEAPVMSTLTKGVTEDHLDYLRILGVNKIILMFDNEKSGQGKKGEAVTKSRIVNRFGADDVRVTNSDCAAADASEALISDTTAGLLHEYLQDLTEV